MVKIDLHDYYPHNPKGSFTEVSEEVAAALKEFERQDVAAQMMEYRYKAYFSLDALGDIENDVIDKPATPEELLEQDYDKEILARALSCLSPKQSRRVYARYILEKSIADIARMEGVHRKSVTESINRALHSLAKYFEEN